MDTITQNKNQLKNTAPVKLAAQRRRKNTRAKATNPELMPGKTIEQIRTEAVQHLREIGIII
jgi:hypothetical protein